MRRFGGPFFFQRQQDLETAIAADEVSAHSDRNASTKEQQDLAPTEQVKKSWHYTQESFAEISL